MAKSIQASITSPSYIQQCLDFKNSGVDVLALSVDAASATRLARSCEQVGYFPKLIATSLAVGIQKQYVGNKWLANTVVPTQVFPWMADSTPAQKYYQAAVAKYNPGFDSGMAASYGWAAGALLVAASAGLTADNPTTQQLLDTLWTFKGQKFTEFGGLTGRLVYQKDGNPKIPYCLFAAISNEQNTGWRAQAAPKCLSYVAPSDPQKAA